MPHPTLLHNMSSPPKTLIQYRSDTVSTGHQKVCFTTIVRVLRLSEKQLFEHCRKHSENKTKETRRGGGAPRPASRGPALSRDD